MEITSFKMKLLLILVLVIVAINLVQFFKINSDVPAHHKAIHNYGAHDVIELGTNNAENTHNLFTNLNEITHQPCIIVPDGHVLARESHDYRARLIGLVQPEKIAVVDSEIDTTQLLDELTEHETYEQDTIWEWPGYARAEDMETATKWSIYLDGDSASTLILLDEGNEAPQEWQFVDADLLSTEMSKLEEMCND